MALAAIIPPARLVFCDANGKPLAGGQIWTYVPGGQSLAATWADTAQSAQNPNPVPLDSAGSCQLYGNGQYQLATYDALGNAVPGASGLTTIWPISAAMAPVVAASSVTGAFDLLAVNGGTIGGPITGTLAVTGTLEVLGEVHNTNTGVFTNGTLDFPFTTEINGANPGTLYQLSHAGSSVSVGLVSAIEVSGGSTQYEVDAIAGYVRNSSTVTGAAGGSFFAYSGVAGAVSWATNFLASDQGLQSTVSGSEIDIGVSNTLSAGYGINMLGVFPNGTPAVAIPYQVSVLHSPWQWAFVSYNGAAEQFALIGASGTVSPSNGQALQFNVINSGGTVVTAGLQAVVNGSDGVNLIATTASGEFEIAGQFSATGTTNFLAGFTNAIAGTGALADFFSGSTAVGSISTNGTTTAYNTTSDRELKYLHGPADGSIIDSVKIYTGSYKADPVGVKRSMLVADELQQVAPWMVTGMPGEVHQADVKGAGGRVLAQKGTRKWQMVDHSMLIPDLVAKCQALQAELTALRAAVGK